jgi:FMN phosphatase YigB (HAD superfamily)
MKQAIIILIAMKIVRIPPLIEGLIFDVDLTLYDSREYYNSQKYLLVKKLAEKTGKSCEETLKAVDDYQQDYMKTHNGKKLTMGNLFFLRFGVSIEENCRWRSSLFHPEDYLQRDEKLIQTMEKLSAHLMLAAVTNNTEEIGKRTLRVLGIEGFFPVIVGLDRTLVSKPSMKPFTIASKEMGIPLSRCISIGDRMEVDVELPVREGMGGILVESMRDIYKLPAVLIDENDDDRISV